MLGAGAAQAKANWTRAETRHFVFFSSGQPAELETFAIEAEKFDAMLRARFNIPEDEIVNRLTIYVLPDGASVAKLMGDPNSGLAGFYKASPEGSFAVSNRDRADSKFESSGQQVLFHEYTHHFFSRYLPAAYPVWLGEGFAEYYSTTTFKKDGTYTYGAPVWGRAYGLVEGKQIPIRTILFNGTEGMDARTADIFYGRSWLFTHSMMSTPEGLKTLDTYIADLNHGLDPKEAAQKDFGDLDALDKAVEKMERQPLTMFTSKLPVTFDAGYVAVRLDEPQSRLIELQLQRRAQEDKVPARDALRALAAAYPGRADVLYELAEAEYDVARQTTGEAAENVALAETETAADRVLAIQPGHARANVLKAEVMLDRYGSKDGNYIAARKYLVKANRADTDDPLPLYLYYQSYAQNGEHPPEIALDGLYQSFSRAKEVTDFRIALAYALVDERRYDEAIQLVRFLAGDPHGGAQGKAILAELLQAKQTYEESGEAPPADAKGASAQLQGSGNS